MMCKGKYVCVVTELCMSPQIVLYFMYTAVCETGILWSSMQYIFVSVTRYFCFI